jgi:protein phosphatase
VSANHAGDRVARRRACSPLLEDDPFGPRSAAVAVTIGAWSERGTVRVHNDDHYLILRLGRSQETIATSLTGTAIPDRFDEAGYGMVVADGIGTGAAASVSRVAVRTLVHLVLHFGRWNMRIDPRSASEILERIESCSGALDNLSTRGRLVGSLPVSPTTLTAAYSAGDEIFIAHVGRSRAYFFRDGALRQLTRDQTIHQQLDARLRPLPAASSAEDLRHILTDAISGAAGTARVQLARVHARDGDSLMLCTDGVTDAVADDQIADLLADNRSPAEQCRSLTSLAIDQGSQDNVTVVVARYCTPTGGRSALQ